MGLRLLMTTRNEYADVLDSPSSHNGLDLDYFLGSAVAFSSSPVSTQALGLSPTLIIVVLTVVLLCTAVFLGGTWVLAHSQNSMGRILRLAMPERHVLTGATVCMLFQTVCQMPLVWIFGQFIDLVTEQLATGDSNLPMQKLEFMLLFLVGVVVSGSVVGALSSFLFSLAGERITRRLRADFFRSLLIQDMAFFDTHQSGEWLNRLASDAGKIQGAASTNLAMFLNNLAQFVGGVMICLAISWQLFVIIFVVMPLMIAIAIYSGKKLKKLSKQYQSSLATAGGIAGETFGSMRTIRAFANGEAKQLEDYIKELDAAFLTGRRRARVGAFLSVAMGLLIQFAIVGSLAAGGMMVVKGIHHQKGGMPAGSLTSFLMYALWAAGAVGGLVGLYNDMSQAIGASQRVFEVIERQPAIPSTLCRIADDLLTPSECFGAVSFESVYFAYSSTQPNTLQTNGDLGDAREEAASEGMAGGRQAAMTPLRSARQIDVLKGINFSVQPGWVTALVGPSGGGKSTIISMIMRLYDPREGVVCLDGHDLTTLDPRWLRKQMGVVLQEPLLFSRSIRENITYGLQDPATDEEVEAVARKANAHNFVSKFPGSYDALCGERGVRLSGGEKQRIAIARALLMQPRVLLMDEATSALDAESERLVQESMDLLLHETADRHTVFMIAHRLSTVQSANVILVIQDGHVEEQGTHAELVKQNGLYAKLAMHQRLDQHPS